MTKAARTISGTLAGVFFGLFLGSASMRPGSGQTPQGQPSQEVRKPNYDYMSTFLSRSTHPLGLKEDPAARRMLGQGSIPWAIRAGSRHILD